MMRMNHIFFLVIVYSILSCPFANAESKFRFTKPVEDFLFAEQALMIKDSGDPWVLVKNTSNQDLRFRPESRPKFKIRTYWIQREKLPFFEASGLSGRRKRQLVKSVDGKEFVKLFVHPESENFYRPLTANAERGPDYWASPTSSSRTLVVATEDNPSDAFMVKLSLDATLGEVDRKIKASEVARSVGHTTLIQEYADSLPSSFRILPEVAGAYWKGEERGGQIIREFPPELLQGRTRIVPFFSLFGSTRSGSRPLLAKLLAASDQTAQDLIVEKILRPYALISIEMLLRYGVSAQDHSQNLLVELDSHQNLTGEFYHRDLGGFFIDLARWKRLGASIDKRDLPRIESVTDEYYQWARDFSVIEHFRTYFMSAVVYDLEVYVRRWIRNGWIPKQKLNRTELEWAFLLEMEAAYEKLTGKSVAFHWQLTTLMREIRAGRRSICASSLKRVGTNPKRSPRKT